MLAREFSLALAVAPFTMPADGTRLAGIAWVDLHDRDSRERCLVREESRELLERPARQLVASISAPSRDPSPDAFEVLDGNPAAGAPGGLDDRLAGAMVFMTAEPGLLAGYPHEFLLGSSGSLPLEALSLDVVLAADSFDRLAAMPLGVIARGGDPGDSHVHADEVRHGDRRTFRNIDGDDQKPLAVLPEHQVTLTLALGQSFCLITPQKEGHDYTAFERQQADPVDALKAHGPDVVGHRGVTAELGPLALVPPVSLANPVDAQASHLGRQAKPLTDLTIGDLLQADLVGDLLVEGNSGKPVRSLIKPFHGFAELASRFGVGDELDLDHELHESTIDGFDQ